MALIQPIALSVPFMVVNGNLEYGYKSGGEKDLTANGPFWSEWGYYTI